MDSTKLALRCAALPDDPDAPSITAIPPEIMLILFEWLGPRSVKRVGVTCHAYWLLVKDYVTTTPYALFLARSAVRHLATSLCERHQMCAEPNKDTLALRASLFAARIAATLAECDAAKPMETWDKGHFLRLLYPIAVHVPGAWVLAPYALEWCALMERRILCPEDKEHRPRSELLALLCPDALDILAGLAKKTGWAMGTTFVVTTAAACHTITAETAPLIGKTVETLANSALKTAARNGDIVLCIATMAATTVLLPKAPSGRRYADFDGDLPTFWDSAKPPGAPSDRRGVCVAAQGKRFWDGLRNVGARITRTDLPAEDALWLNLTGFVKASGRSPLALLGQFDCRSGEARTVPPAIGALANLAFLIALGGGPAPPPPVVNVPDAFLGALLAQALAGGDGGADEDTEDEEAPPDLDEEDR